MNTRKSIMHINRKMFKMHVAYGENDPKYHIKNLASDITEM